MNYVIACDPGVGGGFAVFEQTGKLLELMTTECRYPMANYNLSTLGQGKNNVCIIEDVHGWEGQGAKATFAFGRSFGRCEKDLESASNQFIRKVSPQKWQSALGVPKLDYDNRKRWIQKKVEELYPGYGKIPRWASDAVAIGHLYLKGELGLP